MPASGDRRNRWADADTASVNAVFADLTAGRMAGAEGRVRADLAESRAARKRRLQRVAVMIVLAALAAGLVAGIITGG
ncbi:hypothetical protein SMC26_22760 [Actinomadura fulvescens]|uniref:Uncharacterized protein n=1 Tax=Actinomadura fulvescens TaxID=46160 RepID=A0ABN3QNV2_9ACTN